MYVQYISAKYMSSARPNTHCEIQKKKKKQRVNEWESDFMYMYYYYYFYYLVEERLCNV